MSCLRRIFRHECKDKKNLANDVHVSCIFCKNTQKNSELNQFLLFFSKICAFYDVIHPIERNKSRKKKKQLEAYAGYSQRPTFPIPLRHRSLLHQR